MLLSIFSFFEGKLKELSKEVEQENKFTIKIDDLKANDDLSQLIKYLIKVYGINYTEIERHYTPIKQQKYVRNKIAHNDCCISKNDKGKIEEIKKTDNLSLSEWGDSFLIKITSPEYLKTLLENIGYFFLALLQSIDDRFKALK